ERAIARRSMIVTSNRAPADWYALFPNPVVAGEFLDAHPGEYRGVPQPPCFNVVRWFSGRVCSVSMLAPANEAAGVCRKHGFQPTCSPPRPATPERRSP